MVKKPLLIGMLLSKDDGDIIKDVMGEYNKQFDTIFAIDASDDGSLDIIRSFDKVEYAVHERDLGIDGSMLKDGIRQLLLSRIQDQYGYEGWIFPIQSDEIFFGNPASLVDVAIDERANVLNAIIAHFVLSREDWRTELQPHICDRKLYHFLGQPENCGFKNQKGLYYNFFEHMRTIPHGFYPQVTCSRFIVRRHYNMRTEEQVRKRAEDRVKRGWQPAYARLLGNQYIDNPKDLITCGDIYSEICKFDGEFNFSSQYEYLKQKIVR